MTHKCLPHILLLNPPDFLIWEPGSGDVHQRIVGQEDDAYSERVSISRKKACKRFKKKIYMRSSSFLILRTGRESGQVLEWTVKFRGRESKERETTSPDPRHQDWKSDWLSHSPRHLMCCSCVSCATASPQTRQSVC